MIVDRLLPDLKKDEGWRSYAYKDSLGYWTIGYGFLIDDLKGVGLPKEVGEYWLRYAVNERLSELRRRWPAFEKQPIDVQVALGNMCFNLGVAGVLNFRKMLAALEACDYNRAADEALDSLWAKQVPGRAKRVTELMRNVRKTKG